ncbi:MAG: transcription termination/antitermination NusG family protein, partial [Pseudomonadota bacterium]|nr:transcription termination/antitermination NusG family protein [Pseudomonadota bacterium]
MTEENKEELNHDVSENSSDDMIPEDASPVEDNPNFKWYVVRIATGKENKFKELLDERIKREHMASYFGQVLIPTEDVVELRAGQKRQVKRKFFPGYALIR